MASNPPRNYNTNNFTDLQNQVDDVKGVMTQNIEKILQRGDKLEDLVDKTNDLETSIRLRIGIEKMLQRSGKLDDLVTKTNKLERDAKKVKRKMWWKNLKMMIILGIVVAIILGVIILIIVIQFGGGKGGGSKPTHEPESTTSTHTSPPGRLHYKNV